MWNLNQDSEVLRKCRLHTATEAATAFEKAEDVLLATEAAELQPMSQKAVVIMKHGCRLQFVISTMEIIKIGTRRTNFSAAKVWSRALTSYCAIILIRGKAGKTFKNYDHYVFIAEDIDES